MHQAVNVFFLIYFVYHILVGIPALLSVKVTRYLAFKLYKLELEDDLDLKYQYALKCLGFYALYTACLCYIGMVEGDSVVKAKLMFALAFLTMLRALFRWVSRDLIQTAFNLKTNRNVFHVILNGCLSLTMFFLAYQLTLPVYDVGLG